MHVYQIKIKISPYKTDEFVKSMRMFSRSIRKHKGCLGFGVYRDLEQENTCCLFGEWKSLQAMENHFGTNDFEVLIGAAKVLGETFVMTISEVSLTGGFELAREQIASQQEIQ